MRHLNPMRHTAVTCVFLFSVWYVIETRFHMSGVSKLVEISIYPYADALAKQLGGLLE